MDNNYIYVLANPYIDNLVFIGSSNTNNASTKVDYINSLNLFSTKFELLLIYKSTDKTIYNKLVSLINSYKSSIDLKSSQKDILINLTREEIVNLVKILAFDEEGETLEIFDLTFKKPYKEELINNHTFYSNLTNRRYKIINFNNNYYLIDLNKKVLLLDSERPSKNDILNAFLKEHNKSIDKAFNDKVNKVIEIIKG